MTLIMVNREKKEISKHSMSGMLEGHRFEITKYRVRDLIQTRKLTNSIENVM